MAVFEEFLEVCTPHLSVYPQWQVGEEGENGIRREGEVGKTLTVAVLIWLPTPACSPMLALELRRCSIEDSPLAELPVY